MSCVCLCSVALRSSSRWHGLVTNVWLWYFLILLTYVFHTLSAFVNFILYSIHSKLNAFKGVCNIHTLERPLYTSCFWARLQTSFFRASTPSFVLLSASVNSTPTFMLLSASVNSTPTFMLLLHSLECQLKKIKMKLLALLRVLPS